MVKRNGLHLCDEYIAAIIDRFHEVILIFDRETGQFKRRFTDCPGVKCVQITTDTCYACNSNGKTIFVWNIGRLTK